MSTPFNAFCLDSDAYLPGASDGALAGLTFAAKDIFDVAGHVTGCGNPHWKATHDPAETTARVVQTLVDAGATMVGKTITDELTRGIFGENMHYGAPRNPRAPGRVPGGSSSGSASAVAGKLVDFALGSDTGGSVRVPASFCGLYGLRPTHGRIPLEGMLLQATSYDTIGWFARDAEMFARVGAVILPAGPATPRPRRLVVAEDAFELVDASTRSALESAVESIAGVFNSRTAERLSPTSLEEWSGSQQILQSREAWLSIRDWLDAANPTMSFEVADRYVTARAVTDEQVAEAQEGRAAVISRMDEVFRDGETVVCLPSTVGPAPPLGQAVSGRHTLRLRNSALTSIAGNTGRPQISLPIAEADGVPVGLSLLGDYNADERLIEMAQEIAAAV